MEALSSGTRGSWAGVSSHPCRRSPPEFSCLTLRALLSPLILQRHAPPTRGPGLGRSRTPGGPVLASEDSQATRNPVYGGGVGRMVPGAGGREVSVGTGWDGSGWRRDGQTDAGGRCKMLPQHHTCPAFAGSLLSATPEAHRWPGRGLLPHPLGWGGREARPDPGQSACTGRAAAVPQASPTESGGQSAHGCPPSPPVTGAELALQPTQRPFPSGRPLPGVRGGL